MLVSSISAIAEAAPGSGTAVIIPSTSVVAGSDSTWTIRYTASEPFSSGTIHLYIPLSWSVPQIVLGTTAGYVTVSSEGTLEVVPVSIDGSIVKVHIDTLSTSETVDIVYGDDSVSSSGKATAQTVAQSGVQFLLLSDPVSTSPAAIGLSPSLNVVAGPISKLSFTTPVRTFQSDSESTVMRVRTEDQYGNPQNVVSSQSIDLSSTSAGGSFSSLSGGSWSPVTSVSISAGENLVSFYYRDTIVDEPVITASASGQSWTDVDQSVTVLAGTPVQLTATPEDSTVTAGDFARFIIRITDINENPSPAPSGQTITLLAGGGSFYDKDDHGSTISSIVIPAGDTSVEVDYMHTVMNETTGYLIAFFDGDGVVPSLEAFTTLIYIQPSVLDAASSALSVDKVLVTADGTDQVSVNVTATDAFGNPVSGGTVLIDATDTGGGNDITQPVGVTGSDGVATGTVRS
ncbi:MAG: Ig-like domain-containing protein, partial [Candidatus Krumholzibacteriota bacterium]|nr:Ig-like domain-containing protein [Candidatus Krumholzibacteriota bacterium]